MRPTTVRLALLPLVALFTASTRAAERPPLRLYAAAGMASAPEIDGRLDDPAWQPLEVTARFTRTLTGGGLADAQTWCRMGYDRTWLYVAFRCHEPRMSEAQKSMGGPEAWSESVEPFIDADTKAMLAAHRKSTEPLRAKAATVPTIAKDTQRYLAAANNEDAVLAVLQLLTQNIERARAIHDEVRLAVIEGEFR